MKNEELTTFLTHIWGTEQGTVFLASKQVEAELWRVGSPQIWPDAKEFIIRGIVATNALKDVYFTPGIAALDATTKERASMWRIKSLWLDLDGYKGSQTAPETALKLLKEAGLPLPTYRIQTSSEAAQHWYWVLEDYIPASEGEALNRRLAYFLGGDTACWDASHVMRPPFTHNHKPDRQQEDGSAPAVSIIDFTAEVHTASRFESIPQVKEQIREELELGEIPDINTVLMRYPWDREYTELFKRDQTHFWNEEAKDFQSRGMAMVKLAYFCAEIGMSDEAIYAVMLDVDDRWGKFKDRRDRHSRLAEIVTKARTKYPSALITQIQETSGTEEKHVYGFLEFLNTEFQFNWIYEDFLGENTINFITARPGVGKSRFTLQLASHLALGREFLGWKLVGPPRRVVFLSLEMGKPVIKKFMESLVASSDFTNDELTHLDEYFKIVPAGEAFPFTSPQGQGFMEMVFSEYKPDVIFIDAMGSLTYEDLNEKLAKEIMNELKRHLNKHDCSFYIVHHNRKETKGEGNKPPTLDDFYGNTYGATDAASVLALWKNPLGSADHVELHTLKSRLGITEKPVVLHAKKAFTYSVVKDDEIVYSEPPKPGRPKKSASSLSDQDSKPKPEDGPPSGLGMFGG
jgi:hypothetical protein